MKIKSYALKGIALDWAVAKAINNSYKWSPAIFISDHGSGYFHYSTDGSTVASLLEELKISMLYVEDDDPLPIEDGPWTAAVPGADWGYTGPTALVALCRCYVSHKLGENIEIPDELFKE